MALTQIPCLSIRGGDRFSVKQIFLFCSLMLSMSLLGTVAAQSGNGISAGVPDPGVLSLHEKVDDLFKRGEVDRAYFIYRNELVPLGDKYAQYMVGYMHHSGLAVSQDLVAASAWYRLAAERGTKEFAVLRDQLLNELTVEQRDRSNALYRELRRQYCDLAVLLTSIKRLSQEFARARKTNLRDLTGSSYDDKVRRDMRSQLKLLARLGNFEGLETSPSKVDIEEIERLVSARIDELSD